MPKTPRYTRKTADRHELYELSVQEPEPDVDFLDRVFRKLRDRRAISLQEDFCGTAWLCRTWVESHKKRTAVGVDLDPECLEWGARKHLKALGPDAARVKLLEKNVLDVKKPACDIRVAFNFSYCLFMERPELLKYFKVARRSLSEDGLFVIDLHGGPEAQQEIVERKKRAGFTYVWEQGEMNPLDSIMDCHISFEFKDDTKWKRAFSYHWRLWGLAELRDLMAEAGFSKTQVYWEGEDENGEGNGIYRLAKKKVTNDPSWVAYVVAIP